MATSHKDVTFRKYTPEQAQAYAAGRGRGYGAALLQVIFQHHSDTGGEFNTLADIGCGPGNATCDLALDFDHAFGLDPGSEMINAARSKNYKTKSGEDVVFRVAGAEEISTVGGLEPASIDMITAATSAHWFDMPKFWIEAAKVLKPGGTVAIWIKSSGHVHSSMPNSDQIQAVGRKFWSDVLAPYDSPGNKLAHNYYDDIVLPWDSQCSPDLASEFPSALFQRKIWDRDGVLSNGKTFFGFEDSPDGGAKYNLQQWEKVMETTSQVTRWREAHPGLVGTDEDCMKVAVRQMKEAMGENEYMIGGQGTALLMFKKAT